MENIFSGVSRNNEDATTELLANLMEVKYVRDLILDGLGVGREISSQIKKEDIATQVNYAEDGKPDIVIENSDTLLLIENKIRIETDLQPTQISTYLERLRSSKKKNKKMIYIVPEGYSHLDDIRKVPQIGVDCSIVHWEPFMQGLYANDLHKWSEIVSQSLGHLSDLILRKEISTTLSREELIVMFNPKDLIAANGLLIKMRDFISSVLKSLIPSLGKDFDYASWSAVETEMGQYVRYKKDSWSLFLGFSFATISKHPDKSEYLFSLAIKKDIVDIEKAKVFSTFPYEEWIYFKLDKYSASDLNNPPVLATEICHIIQSVIV